MVQHAPLSMEILQARILEWVDMPSSRGFSQTRDQTQVSDIAGRLLTVWANIISLPNIQEYVNIFWFFFPLEFRNQVIEESGRILINNMS